jgi:hypothetical protein
MNAVCLGTYQSWVSPIFITFYFICCLLIYFYFHFVCLIFFQRRLSRHLPVLGKDKIKKKYLVQLDIISRLDKSKKEWANEILKKANNKRIC